MKYTIGNYWLSSRPWRNGDIMFRDQDIPRSSTQIIRLTYFWSAQKLNWRQARWSLYLSEFNVKLIHQSGSKMVQSDTLSRWPDLVPAKDTDKKNMTLLLENLFLNLLDLTLQDRVLGLGQLDDFLKNFLSMIHPLKLQATGNWNSLREETPCFTKDKTMFLTTWTYNVTLSKCYMIMRWQVILGRLKLWCQLRSYTGGQDFRPLSGLMWRGVVFASSTKLTNRLPIPPICQSLRLWLPDLSHIVPWT